MDTPIARTLFVALLGLLVVGCTAIPQKEFKAYRDAFDQSRTVVQEVLIDYSAAAEENTRRQQELAAEKAKGTAPKVVPQFPTRFETRVETKPGTVKERLRALDTIAYYNELLASLAEGKSVEQVQASVGALITTAQSLVTLVPGAGELLIRIFGELEKARTREEFKKAVANGEDPIKKILAFFKDEAPLYYALRVSLVESDMSLLRSRIAARVGAIQKIVGGSAPVTPDPWKEVSDQINDELEKIGGLRGLKGPVALAGTCKKPVCPEVSTDQITDTLLGIKQDVAQHRLLVERINTYYALLQRYEHLLEATRLAMTTLRMAVDTPQDVTSQIDDLLSTALALRKDFVKLRSQF